MSRIRSLAGWALASAAGWCGPAGADTAFARRDPSSVVLFGSLEAGPAKTMISAGEKRAYYGAGLDASGFRSLVSAGVAHERASTARPFGAAYKLDVQSLGGYEWRIGEVFVAVYAGSDLEVDLRMTAFEAVMVTRLGLRIMVDLWANPTPETMIQAAAYASTLDNRVWGRLAAGYAVRDGLYLGPESEGYREYDYTKLRLGLHLTGLRFAGLEWRLAGGWQKERERAPSAYVVLGVHWRR